MQPDFWKTKWANSDIGFHLNDVNPLLVKHHKCLSLDSHSKVFVPLCGKTRDIAWLLSQGYKVVAVELVNDAVTQLFKELEVQPVVKQHGKLNHYSYDNLDIFQGSFFDLTEFDLGKVDAVYDRAALVALPKDLRAKYCDHLIKLTHAAPQLLINYSYDQTAMEGPPFAVSSNEIEESYSDFYTLKVIDSVEVSEPLKSRLKDSNYASELVWLLLNQTQGV